MSLGLLPLAGLDAETRALEGAPAAPEALLERGASYLHQRGVLLSSYASLRHFKEKFHPDWEARYLLLGETSATPQVLLALAQVMGGGWRVVAQEAWEKLRANSR